MPDAGARHGTLDAGNSPEKRQKNTDKAMARLLKDFPPKAKK